MHICAGSVAVNNKHLSLSICSQDFSTHPSPSELAKHIFPAVTSLELHSVSSTRFLKFLPDGSPTHGSQFEYKIVIKNNNKDIFFICLIYYFLWVIALYILNLRETIKFQENNY